MEAIQAFKIHGRDQRAEGCLGLVEVRLGQQLVLLGQFDFPIEGEVGVDLGAEDELGSPRQLAGQESDDLGQVYMVLPLLVRGINDQRDAEGSLFAVARGPEGGVIGQDGPRRKYSWILFSGYANESHQCGPGRIGPICHYFWG